MLIATAGTAYLGAAKPSREDSTKPILAAEVSRSKKLRAGDSGLDRPVRRTDSRQPHSCSLVTQQHRLAVEGRAVTGLVVNIIGEAANPDKCHYAYSLRGVTKVEKTHAAKPNKARDVVWAFFNALDRYPKDFSKKYDLGWYSD